MNRARVIRSLRIGWSVVIGLVCMSFVLVTASSGFAAVFNDGGEHTLDSFDPLVRVLDGEGESPTTVNVVHGADIGSANVYDTSRLNISGGGVARSNFYDSSRLNVSGGAVSYVDLYDSATGTISAGELAHVNAYESSVLLISGGEISHLNYYDSTRGTVLAGDISHVSAHEFSVVEVFGGTYFTASSRELGVMLFYDGNVRRLTAVDNGTTNLFGGNITEYLILDGGVLNVFGTELQRSGNRVVGTLLNQDPIDVRVLFYSWKLNLIIVPEPSTIILTALGALGVLPCRRRKRSSNRLRRIYVPSVASTEILTSLPEI